MLKSKTGKEVKLLRILYSRELRLLSRELRLSIKALTKAQKELSRESL